MSDSNLTGSATPTLSDSYALLTIGHGATSKRIYVATRDVQSPNNTGFYQEAGGSGRLLISAAEYQSLRTAFSSPHSITLTYDDACSPSATPINNVKKLQYLSTAITFVLDSACHPTSAPATGAASSQPR